MGKFQLSKKHSNAIAKIQSDDLSDPIDLINRAGLDKSNFFENGVFEHLDFRKSDLDGVSFHGAKLREIKMYEDQKTSIIASKPSSLENIQEYKRPPSFKGRDANFYEEGPKSKVANPSLREILLNVVSHYILNKFSILGVSLGQFEKELSQSNERDIEILRHGLHEAYVEAGLANGVAEKVRERLVEDASYPTIEGNLEELLFKISRLQRSVRMLRSVVTPFGDLFSSLDRASRTVLNMRRSVNVLLDFSKNQKDNFQRERINFQTLILDIFSLMKQEDKELVSFEIEDSVQSFVAVRNLVISALSSLVNAALRGAMSASQPEVRLSAELLDQNALRQQLDKRIRITLDSKVPQWILVSISDNGVGIPEERLSNIWNLGYNFETDTSSSPDDFDYGDRSSVPANGLAMVKFVAEIHGGSVWARNNRFARGVTFDFFIPASDPISKRKSTKS